MSDKIREASDAMCDLQRHLMMYDQFEWSDWVSRYNTLSDAVKKYTPIVPIKAPERLTTEDDLIPPHRKGRKVLYASLEIGAMREVAVEAEAVTDQN